MSFRDEGRYEAAERRLDVAGRAGAVAKELGSHLPYALFSTALGLIVVALIDYRAQAVGGSPARAEGMVALFHVFHPIHLFLSATATTAMFWKYERKMGKAILVGIVGSVGICSLSDIVFPYVGGALAGAKMELHICIVEDPGGIIPFAAAGVLAGLVGTDSVRHLTVFSHSSHVLASTMASLAYLVGHGMGDWISHLSHTFAITVLAVLIPCCTSDILFPLACISKGPSRQRGVLRQR